ncbi:MAG: DUF3313 domain-containing protein [Amphritea sp.]|nr:DUF3313 domain-containing protein [Amphritea sp.]
MALSRWIAPLLISSALLSGCQTQPQKPENTGFLKSYSNFRDHPYVDKAKIWVKPGIDSKTIAQYNSFILAPIEIWPSRTGYSGITAAEIKAMSQAFHNAIGHQLAPDYSLTDKPGSKTAYIRMALTDISRTDPEKNVLDFIPVRLLINAGKDAVLAMQDKEYKIANATLELEFYDSETGELLAMIIDSQTGDKEIIAKNQAGFEDLQKLFNLWSKRFSTTLKSLK